MGVQRLTLVRHGESMGNVADAQAQADGAAVVGVATRDVDTPLSEIGIDQARAWGRWLAEQPSSDRFDAVWCSPFVRAQQTAQLALDTAGMTVPLRVDERLRDRDLGVLDTLTSAGVAARHPDEAARRAWLGKFYHRPAGGESWVDVILRVRSVLRDLDEQEDGHQVLVVCHDAVIMSIRYVLEQLTEEAVLGIARDDPVRNLSVTQLTQRAPRQWRVDCYNDVSHLEWGRRIGDPPSWRP